MFQVVQCLTCEERIIDLSTCGIPASKTVRKSISVVYAGSLGFCHAQGDSITVGLLYLFFTSVDSIAYCSKIPENITSVLTMCMSYSGKFSDIHTKTHIQHAHTFHLCPIYDHIVVDVANLVNIESGTVAHNWNPSTQEAKTEGSWVPS